MDEEKHVGGESEAAGLQYLGDALADEVGLGRGLPVAPLCSVISANELARFLQSAAPLLVTLGQLAQIGRNFQAVHRLQADGRSPVMPAHRLAGESRAGFVGEGIEAVGGHGLTPLRSGVDLSSLANKNALRRGRSFL